MTAYRAPCHVGRYMTLSMVGTVIGVYGGIALMRWLGVGLDLYEPAGLAGGFLCALPFQWMMYR